jgi:hypothetical protein
MLLQIKGLQMLIDEEKSNCKMMIGILSTLSDKTLNEWRLLGVLYCFLTISLVQKVIKSQTEY